MTTQESFKRRIRERMATTGERYNAARRVLIEQAQARTASGGRTWVSQPELSDERVREATGQGWDEWCDVLDRRPAAVDGHTAIARHLTEVHGVEGWWAQTVTVGYERITGLRLPGQMADGTFTVSKSKTIDVDAGLLRELLLDDDARADLFPGQETELRSKPTAKTLRLKMEEGTAQVAIADKGGQRSTVTVSHEKLPSADAADRWRHLWAEWLDALAGET